MQELASFPKSAHEMLVVEESVKKDFNKSLEFAQETVLVQQPKPSCEQTNIVITIEGKDELKQLRVYKDAKFESLFNLYDDKLKLDLQKMVFSFDGDKFNPSATPEALGMKYEDIIKVLSK